MDLQSITLSEISEMEKDKYFAPNANSTIRYTYGQVKNYAPKDGVTYNYYSIINYIPNVVHYINGLFIS